MELPCAERQGKGCREGTGKAEAASRACARTYIYIGCRAGLRQAQSETMGMRAEETGKRTIRDNMYIIPKIFTTWGIARLKKLGNDIGVGTNSLNINSVLK